MVVRAEAAASSSSNSAGQFARFDCSFDIDVGRVATHHVAVARCVGDGAAHDGVGGVFGAGANDDFAQCIGRLFQHYAQSVATLFAGDGDGHDGFFVTEGGELACIVALAEVRNEAAGFVSH